MRLEWLPARSEPMPVATAKKTTRRETYLVQDSAFSLAFWAARSSRISRMRRVMSTCSDSVAGIVRLLAEKAATTV